jgi:hypothetical protein
LLALLVLQSAEAIECQGTVELLESTIGDGARGAAALPWSAWGTTTIRARVTNNGTMTCSYFVSIENPTFGDTQHPDLLIRGNREYPNPGGAFPGDGNLGTPDFEPIATSEVMNIAPGNWKNVDFDVMVDVTGPSRIDQSVWLNPVAGGYGPDGGFKTALHSPGHEDHEDVCVLPQYDTPLEGTWGPAHTNPSQALRTAHGWRGSLGPDSLRFSGTSLTDWVRETGEPTSGADSCFALLSTPDPLCPPLEQVTGGKWRIFPNHNSNHRDEWGYVFPYSVPVQTSYDYVGFDEYCTNLYFGYLAPGASCGTLVNQRMQFNCRSPAGKSQQPNWWVDYTTHQLEIELEAGATNGTIRSRRGWKTESRPW